MKFGCVILYVPEVPAALEFYERAFGLKRKLLHESGSYGELATGTTRLAFAAESLASEHAGEFRPSRPKGAPPAVEVVLVTDDVAAAYARATKAGATPLQKPSEKPWGQTVAYVRDLNGFLVELCTAWD
jgi:catechol 2,3-dioxygenase-like lactoylglutathione lyase family enzyme